MKITMTDSRLDNCTQLSLFLHGSEEVSFALSKRSEKYQFAKDLFNRFSYRHLQKSERGTVRNYLQKITGYSTSQTTRLVTKYLGGKLFLATITHHSFPPRYFVTSLVVWEVEYP